jgi:hypothetical protein
MGLAILPLFPGGRGAEPLRSAGGHGDGWGGLELPPAPAALWSLGLTATNALVLAHYFADAFLYRFRIPKVREVTLGRWLVLKLEQRNLFRHELLGLSVHAHALLDAK